MRAAVVDDPRTNAICSWNETVAMDGVPPGGVHAFTVHDNGALEKDVLPTFYNHSNFTSFIRQLNQYSFRKLEPKPNASSSRGTRDPEPAPGFQAWAAKAWTQAAGPQDGG